MGINATEKIKNGQWVISMRAVENDTGNGGKSGEFGHITFTPNAKAPDTDALKLLQVVKVTRGSASAEDLQWSGDEERRNDAMTSEDSDAGVEGGYFVDLIYGNREPREDTSDPGVSPYYNEDYEGRADASGNWEHGHKKGSDIKETVLRDYPGTTAAHMTFQFETQAKGEDTGFDYGTIKWHFTVQNKKVKDEGHTVHEGASATLNAAVEQFDEVFKNPGASTSPEQEEENRRSSSSGGGGGGGGGGVDWSRKACCFAGDVLVAGPDGARPIASLAPGDLVFGRCARTGDVAVEEVLEVQVHRGSFEMLDLGFGDGAVSVTGGHRFGTSEGDWARSDRLRPGAELSSRAGAVALDAVASARPSDAPVYNITVPGGSYFVGDVGVLVRDH